MEVQLRLTMVEAKIMVLMVQIQQGKLTMEGYQEILTKKISEEKSLAKIFMANGQKDLAASCIHRTSVMEKELSGEI